MIALILAAGYGTRLYPLTRDLPKALLPVKGKPILQHVLDKIQAPALGLKQALFVSNHKYLLPLKERLNAVPPSVPWTVLDDGSTSEENRLGSMGDLAFAVRSGLPEKEDLLVLGSDNLFRDDLVGFVRFAREKAPDVTLGAYELPQREMACRYGVLALREDRVASFEEKPREPRSSLVSTAVYFFPFQSVHWVLEYVQGAPSADTLGSFIQWLIAKVPVFAYRLSGPWFDIGDMASYRQAEEHY